MPRVTYVIAAYNSRNYIGDALTSILCDEFEDRNIIVVDDASSDATDEVLGGFSPKDVTVIRNNSNVGPAISRQIAIDRTDSEFVAILDSDDMNIPGRTKRQVDFLDRFKETSVVGGGRVLIDAYGRKLGYRPPVAVRDMVSWSTLWRTPVANPTVMFRRQELSNRSHRFRSDLRFGEDFELWSRLALLGQVDNLFFPLVYYRVHDSQLSGKKRTLNFEDPGNPQRGIHSDIVQRNIRLAYGVCLGMDNVKRQYAVFIAFKELDDVGKVVREREELAKKPMRFGISQRVCRGFGWDLLLVTRKLGFKKVWGNLSMFRVLSALSALPFLIRVLLARVFFDIQYRK